MRRFRELVVLLIGAFLAPGILFSADLRIATYNVENYLDTEEGSRGPKSADSRAKVRECILALRPDVIAFQEMGKPTALQELQASLKKDGLDLPHIEHVAGGEDTTIFVGVLSRYPFAAKRPITNASYLLNGRRFKTSRGFAEVEIKASPSYSFTLITAHLKSKRIVPEADQSDMRLEEAKLLRERIDAILASNPEAELVVLGDFNDTQDSRSTRALIGRGKTKLIDTRPAEKNGDNTPNPNPAWAPRNITWTHYYGKEDSYSRIDYIFLSTAMAKRWSADGSYVLTVPNWGVASDHRPILATLAIPD
jgi:endonuclease/exonuclease/phosphatase family metal-dependent hydrolase